METWVWVKNRYPRKNLGKWNQGLNLRSPGGLISTHTHITSHTRPSVEAVWFSEVISSQEVWAALVLPFQEGGPGQLASSAKTAGSRDM